MVIMLGENMSEGKKKFVEEIEEIYVLFKDLIKCNWFEFNIEKVVIGEYWYGN